MGPLLRQGTVELVERPGAAEDAPQAAAVVRVAIEPSHGIFEISIRFFRQAPERLEAAERNVFDLEQRTIDFPQPKLRPSDQASQPQSAYRRAKPSLVVLLRTSQPLAIRAKQFEFDDMVSERPYAVVILAVDIIRDCSSHGYKLRSRHDWQGPS